MTLLQEVERTRLLGCAPEKKTNIAVQQMPKTVSSRLTNKRPLAQMASMTSPPSSSATSDDSSGRAARLRKDRLRKRRSKEKAQVELDALTREVARLEAHVELLTTQGPSSARYLTLQSEIARAYDEQQRLRAQLIDDMDKAILYQIALWRHSDSHMILDPHRDPFMLHTFPTDASGHAHALRSIMDQQLGKLTPDLDARLPTSVDGGPFSIVLDDYGQDVAFLEMRKYGVMRASCFDVSRGIFDSNVVEIAPDAGIQMSTFGRDLVLMTQRIRGGATIRRIMSIARQEARVVLMYRSLHYDAQSSTYAPEVYAGWFVCEDIPSPNGPLCALRGYTQVQLRTSPQTATADYADYMNRSTRNNALLNEVLRRFDALELN
ncbi:Aste57867_5085 [Aphanomyces stellatus]|uniref:Aste57867_5085 protein n=1 Tax=Aphanomyces stellatus TaxID=120398 RepID=A0A485KH47_9STRA|nr:hypothetical protein As57867_005072 [Aphanomyces stellatus]VFT82166.1 Aste57867_5085 [Aphanomyces stellatus]